MPFVRSGALAASAEVLDDQPGPVWLVGQADLHPAGPGVLADVGKGFLRHPVHRQPRVGARLRLGAGDRNLARHAGVDLELGGQVGQPLRAGQRVVPEHADRAPRFLQPGLGQPVSPVDALTSLIRNEDTAQPVTQALLLPLYFISGIFVAVSILPHWIADVGEIFPVRHLANALLIAYNPHTTGLGFAGLDLLIVAAWGAAGLLVALRTFSWQPLGR
jgi:hypothetical protein